MSHEFNKGYNSYGAGPGHSHEFRQGVWARQQEERRAREAAERSARERDEDFARQVSERAQAVNPGFSMGWAQSVGDTNAGARFSRGGIAHAMKNGAFLGVVLCLLYAFVYTSAPHDAWLAYVLAGGFGGALAGAALHMALIVLRWVVVALAWGLVVLLALVAVMALWQAL